MPRTLALAAAVLVAAASLALLPSPAAAATGDASVLAFGPAPFRGSTEGSALRAPLAGMAATPSGQGYWLVSGDGGVFAFGDAVFRGSAGGLRLNHPIVGMAATPSGAGYWLVARDGGVFAFGDAAFRGSAGGLRLNHPIVGMAATPSGAGYWLVARDGGVFAFGDAVFHGSTGGTRLNHPVVGLAPAPGGQGYWLVAGDGGIFAFGAARYLGSTGALRLARPVVAMAATPSGLGYWVASADAGVFAFGDAPFHGAGTGSLTGGRQVVGMAAAPGGGYWLVSGRPSLGLGALAPGVEGMQRRLLELGYWGPVDGRFGPLTVQQVYAFQKVNGLPRDGRLDGAELALLQRAGRPAPRSTSGYVAEVDKTRQVIILARDGYAEWVFNTSTGNNRPYGRGAVAVTPEGRFQVYSEINGMRISPLGQLFRPKYFTGGYAIHGSPSIPPLPRLPRLRAGEQRRHQLPLGEWAPPHRHPGVGLLLTPTPRGGGGQRRSLPTLVRGSSSTSSTSRGAQKAGRRSLTHALRAARDGGAPGSAGTTRATTRCPHSGSGRPTTATSATSGWVRSASSPGPGHTFSPPVTTSSARLPSTTRRPSSHRPTSPVASQPRPSLGSVPSR